MIGEHGFIIPDGYWEWRNGTEETAQLQVEEEESRSGARREVGYLSLISLIPRSGSEK